MLSVWITGASSGIGEACAYRYAAQGARLILTSSSVERLDKGGKPHGVMDPGQADGMTAEAAARVITRAIAKEKKEVLVGRKELLMVYIKRFFPGLCAMLARRINPM